LPPSLLPEVPLASTDDPAATAAAAAAGTATLDLEVWAVGGERGVVAVEGMRQAGTGSGRLELAAMWGQVQQWLRRRTDTEADNSVDAAPAADADAVDAWTKHHDGFPGKLATVGGFGLARLRGPPDADDQAFADELARIYGAFDTPRPDSATGASARDDADQDVF
jgi:hypothetical protein